VAYLLAFLAVLLVGGGYVLGSRRARGREAALKRTLDQRTEKLALVEQELAHHAAIEPVTGLHTQQHFQEFLEREWRRASRDRQFVSVMMVEVDHFRAFSERSGKADGDACLRSVADTMKPLIHRASDLVARYGGPGKFGIVLGGTDSRGAMLVSERLRAAVANMKKLNPASSTSEILTLSIGVASAVPDRQAPWQDIQLIASAERALAQAREAGRNTVVLDTHPSPVGS
jgi:two-component system chemotaxis family response regulator WspR